MTNSIRRLVYTLVILIVLVIVILNLGLTRSVLPSFVFVPYWDKLGHFFLLGVLTFLVNLLWDLKKVKVGRWHLLQGSLVMTIIAVVEEGTQAFFPLRTFSVVDLAFSLLGILVFGWLGRKIFR